jgi:hypothetical protein
MTHEDTHKYLNRKSSEELQALKKELLEHRTNHTTGDTSPIDSVLTASPIANWDRLVRAIDEILVRRRGRG